MGRRRKVTTVKEVPGRGATPTTHSALPWDGKSRDARWSRAMGPSSVGVCPERWNSLFSACPGSGTDRGLRPSSVFPVGPPGTSGLDSRPRRSTRVRPKDESQTSSTTEGGDGGRGPRGDPCHGEGTFPPLVGTRGPEPFGLRPETERDGGRVNRLYSAHHLSTRQHRPRRVPVQDRHWVRHPPDVGPVPEVSSRDTCLYRRINSYFGKRGRANGP